MLERTNFIRLEYGEMTVKNQTAVDLVRDLACYGCTNNDIALFLGVHFKTASRLRQAAGVTIQPRQVWSQADADLLADFELYGCDIVSVAQYFNASLKAVRRTCERYGVRAPKHPITIAAARKRQSIRRREPRPTPSMPRLTLNKAPAWPRPEYDKLIALTAEGYSAAEVARRLNEEFGATRTRNAVIGKLNRIGGIKLTPEARARKNERDRQSWLRSFRKRQRHAPVTAARVKRKKSALQEALLNLPEYPTDLDNSDNAISLFNVRDGTHCKFVLGDPAAMTMCGAAPVAGHSWCPRHARVVYKQMGR